MTCSLDYPEIFRPSLHVWMAHKLGWDIVADGLPQHAEFQTKT